LVAAPPSILELDNRPQSWGSLLRELWRYRDVAYELSRTCLLYTSPSPRDRT